MAAIFKYNNQLFQCMNLQKKLKKMKIKDVEIIWEGEATQSELEKKFNSFNSTKETLNEDNKEITLYTFINDNGYKIVSINNMCPDGYKFAYDMIYKI